jgi:hypothetical protein
VRGTTRIGWKAGRRRRARDTARTARGRGHGVHRGRITVFAAPVRSHELGEAEIEDLDHAFAADHHVRRLEVPMDDAGDVRARNRLGDGDGQPEGISEPHPVGRDDRAERLPGHVLHDDEVASGLGLDLVDGDDIRMVERRGRAGFEQEAAAA